MKLKVIALVSLSLFVASSAGAGPYDGKSPLLCSVYQLFECDPPNGCVSVTPAEILGVSHLDIDFAGKVITRAGVESKQRSTIRSVTTIDGKTIVQGVEDGSPDTRDGAGWSISIMDPEGTMALSTSGDGFGVIGLGACAPKR